MSDPFEPALIGSIRAQYALPAYGRHGLGHWATVIENGERLAGLTGARLDVVRLFAVFHDACRHSEGYDPGHGVRGAALARSLRGHGFSLDESGMAQLERACALHTRQLTDSDITVATCFDADRLDLPRVDITVDPARLATDAARDPKIIAWGRDRAVRGTVMPASWKRMRVSGEAP